MTNRRRHIARLLEKVRRDPRSEHPVRWGLTRGLLPLIFAYFLFLPAQPVLAQGTAQVIVSGIPPILPSPYLSDLEQSYRQGLFTTQFIYTSPSRLPRPFRFLLTLDVNGERRLEMTSEPNDYEPGIHVYRTFDDEPPIRFPLSFGEWITLIDPNIDQTGVLPEGDYVLTIEPIIEEHDALIPTLPGMAFFNVRYAEPPLLLSPFDQSNLTTQFPIFSWTPVTGAPAGSLIEYELLIVEVFRDQAPYQALESNPELVREVLTGQTSFVYSFEQLPLESGKTYAWQVRARDVAERLPILDRGETEFHTFTVGAQGLGSMVTSWSYPVTEPFLHYEFENIFELDPSDTELYFDGQLPVKFNDLSTQATFDGLLIDTETQSIIEGSITLNEAMAIEVGLNPLSDMFSGHTVVPSGSPLTLEEGMLLELGSNIDIDAEGLHPRGTQRAVVAYAGQEPAQWNATYSQDFSLSLTPFSITSGRVDFAADGVAIAYADPAGFHLIERSDPVIAQLPDRIVLPHARLAYVPLKRAGNALVNVVTTDAGTLELQPGGHALEMVLPALSNPLQAEPLRVPARLADVVIDAATGSLLSGSIEAEVPESDAFTLDAFGIPFAPSLFASSFSSGEPRLTMEGRLTLFGRTVQNTAPFSLSINEEGIVSGNVALDNADGTVYLDPASAAVALHIHAANGRIHAPILKNDPPLVDIDVAGRFSIHTDENISTAAELAFHYTGDGPVELLRFAGIPSDEAASFSTRALQVNIRSIESLSLAYSFDRGARFAASVRSDLTIFPGDSEMTLPLSDVELRQNGIAIPRQEMHAGIPSFVPQSFEKTDASYTLLAMRMPAGVFDLYSPPNSRTDAPEPRFDFEVRLNDNEGIDGALTRASFTLQEARIEEGLLTGRILPYRFDEAPARWSFDAGDILVNSLAGALNQEGDETGLTLDLKGSFELFPPGSATNTRCTVPDITIRLQGGQPIGGYSDSFTPCDLYRAGDFVARFNEAALRVDSTGRFALEGSLAALQGLGAPTPAQTEGSLSLDVVTGTVIEADAGARRLSWLFPVDAPAYQLQLEEAMLTTDGIAAGHDSAFTAVSLVDNTLFGVDMEEGFVLGMSPGRSNLGNAILTEPTTQETAGAFSVDGFLASQSLSTRPRRIVLPDAAGAYLDITTTDPDGVEFTKVDSGGYTIKTEANQRISLVLPSIGPAGIHPVIPVSVDLQLTELYEYAGGSIEQNFAASPLDLDALGYPMRILSLTYGDNETTGALLTVDVALDLPAAFGIQTGITETLPLSLALTSRGWRTAPFSEASYAFYNNQLSLSVDDVRLSRDVTNQASTISGAVGSPVFGSSSTLRYTASYKVADREWDFDLYAVDNGSIAVGEARLHLDPETPPSLTASPGFVLEVTGSMAMPPSIGRDFVTGITMEIGPGGIYAWEHGSFEAPQPLFDGFLTTHLDAVEIAYNAERKAIVATLDGAFSSRLTMNENPLYAGIFYERIPFSGMRFGSDGRAEFNTDFAGSPRLNLLRAQPPISVIDRVFQIDTIQLDASEAGLQLDVQGAVELPEPSGITESNGTRNIPVAMRLDSHGRLKSAADSLWNPRVFQTTDANGLRNSTGSGSYHVSAAYLDFSPKRPERSTLFLASNLYLPRNSAMPADSMSAAVRLGFGESWNPRRHPGLVLRQHQPQYYLAGHAPNPNRPAYTIETPLGHVEPSSITLADPTNPTLFVSGLARIPIAGLSGALPVEGLTVGPTGITDLGRAAGPAQLAFKQLAAFEVGCFEYLQNEPAQSVNETNARQSLVRLESGNACPSAQAVTLTDRLLPGSYDRLTLYDGFGALRFDLRDSAIDLAGLGAFSGALAYNPEDREMTFNGDVRYQGASFTSTGRLRQSADERPQLSLTISPSSTTLNLIPNLVDASVAGGGLFLRPTQEDLDLLNLALDERSNNQFSSNAPDETSFLADRLAALLPIEARIVPDSSQFEGVGLMTSTSQFAVLDLDGHFLDQPDELSAGLYLHLERSEEQPSLQGMTQISLNYGGVAGGIVKANFYADGAASNWGVFGQSDILLTDTITLPGRFLMTENGMVIDMHDSVDLRSGLLTVASDMNVSIWKDRTDHPISGYTAFDALIDLIPGYSLSTIKLYGGLIEDRDEEAFYAANNIFADVPFVYTGPIDPWISIQQGLVSSGDARNTTFRRMMADARNAGNRLSEVGENLTQTLNAAINAQTYAASDLSNVNEPAFFAQPDSVLREWGQNLADRERAVLPQALETIRAALFEDNVRPDYGHFPGEPADTPAALEALQTMRAGIANARRSAESDIYSFEGLTARPLVWSSDHIQLIAELRSTPLQSIVWPLQSAGVGDAAPKPGFTLQSGIPQLQRNNLLAFKQNNESLDVQFLRGITGLELNLVNLKIARSPDQAATFTQATSQYQRFAARQIADDWSLQRWSREKLEWLKAQESTLDRGIRDHLRAYSDLDNSEQALREVIALRHDAALDIARNTTWEREDLPEDVTYPEYLASLDADALETEFTTTAKNLWFDAPLAALTLMQDTLQTLATVRSERFAAGLDTLNTAYGRFTRALDPFYDIQTRFTGLLYGMAEEYWNWRSSIQRLDPEAVNFAFQFVPYRGNYRILAEDLAPPVIDEIRVSTNNEGYLSENVIEWTAEHPVSLVDQNLTIELDSAETALSGSVADTAGVHFYTARPDAETTERKANVTLRVRGAGGVPAVKKGQFSIAVTPETGAAQAGESTPLVPADNTPPPSPVIAGLSYSSYFAETPNTLRFRIGALRDDESGITRIEYRIVNDRDREDVLQDWTLLQKSTDYFSGRLIETSLPVQENDVTVRVFVRATNSAGLTSEHSESLSLDLDDSPPTGSITRLAYFNAFDIERPNMLRVELSPLRDPESGIDIVEYVFMQNAQANLASADWNSLLPVEKRATELPPQALFLDLSDERIPPQTTTLSLFVRITNGAGLQTVTNQVVQIPPQDQTPPTEPVLALEPVVVEGSAGNRLRIILSGSQDFESGIATVTYRVLDGASGMPIMDWDDFTYIDPDYPTYIFPATEKLISLPAFVESRSILVEAETANRAGLTSRKAVGFVQLDLDDTPPTTPALEIAFVPDYSMQAQASIQLIGGASEDPESPITSVDYRFIDRNSQRVLTNWTPLLADPYSAHVLPGFVRLLDVSSLPVNTPSEVQVRVTNARGLSAVASSTTIIEGDDTPPPAPTLGLTLEREDNAYRLSATIGASSDIQSGISRVRYRIRNPEHTDDVLTPWRQIPTRDLSGQFDGRTISETFGADVAGGALIVDVEVLNGAGLTTAVAGLVKNNPQEISGPARPEIELFYYDSTNTIRSNSLEFTLRRNPAKTTPTDSIYYKVSLVDATGRPLLQGARANWRLLSASPDYLDNPQTTHVDLPVLDGPATASVELRLIAPSGEQGAVIKTLPISSRRDTSPPRFTAVEARYFGYYHPDRANQMELNIGGLIDAESRIARVDYRIVDADDSSRVYLASSPAGATLERGLFMPAHLPVSLPDFSASTTLRVEVTAVNGAGLSERFEQLVPIVVDDTPPEIAEPELTLSRLYDPYRKPQITLNFGEIVDHESYVTEIAYRLFIEGDTTSTAPTWRILESTASNLVRLPAAVHSIDRPIEDQDWRLETRARNAAGLSDTRSGTLRIEADQTAPLLPPIALSYQTSSIGGSFLHIASGAFRDIESQIASIDYRIVNAADRNQVLADWTNLPVTREDRVNVQPVAIPREKIEFAGKTGVAVVFRATNGAGISSTREATISIPGDETPPEAPNLIATHRNAYDPLHPNTIELQIGSSTDDQSAVAEARYRIVEPATGREFAAWTQLEISHEGFFAGAIVLEALPLLQQNVTLRADVEIVNTAGLSSTTSRQIQVDITIDDSPPEITIALHYFGTETALVVEELSDPESKIQQVEYRFLDNVDQTELVGWTNLFEIPVPQAEFPRQSYNVDVPVTRSDRTLKVEVRVTNGAGLQTTVSKTLLFRQEGVGE